MFSFLKLLTPEVSSTRRMVTDFIGRSSVPPSEYGEENTPVWIGLNHTWFTQYLRTLTWIIDLNFLSESENRIQFFFSFWEIFVFLDIGKTKKIKKAILMHYLFVFFFFSSPAEGTNQWYAKKKIVIVK